MKKIGYARVSTQDQNLALQIRALEGAGCEMIFNDHGVSGSRMVRPGLTAAMEALAEGDMLVVWRLDRLGRSLIHLVNLVNELAERNVEFHSLKERIDTSSSGGRLVFHMMAALAEFERSLISERTRAGMQATEKRLGRPPLLSVRERNEMVAAVLTRGQSLTATAQRFNISLRTLRRAIDVHLNSSTIPHRSA